MNTFSFKKKKEGKSSTSPFNLNAWVVTDADAFWIKVDANSISQEGK